eukprot:4931139-Lingulodinium_polyedra.AAC.1
MHRKVLLPAGHAGQRRVRQQLAPAAPNGQRVVVVPRVPLVRPQAPAPLAMRGAERRHVWEARGPDAPHVEQRVGGAAGRDGPVLRLVFGDGEGPVPERPPPDLEDLAPRAKPLQPGP